MSQMTSTARVAARALHRPTTITPRLRVVTGAPPKRGGAAFGIICATLLAAGLIGVLLLNTALAQGSFVLQELQATSDQLTDTQNALSQSLAVSKSPANLALSAAGMGMVPAESAAFLRLSDGKVIGVAEPAAAGPGFNVVMTTQSPPLPKPAAKKVKPATTPATTPTTTPAATPATTPAKPAAKPATKAVRPAGTPAKPVAKPVAKPATR